MANKICNKCNEEKHVDNFCKVSKNKNGLNNFCRQCCAEKAKIYRLENKVKLAEKMSNWRKNNPDKNEMNWKSYQEKNKDVIHKQKMLRQKEKRKDPLFKFKESISNSIRKAITREGTKNNKTTEILGCSFNEFQQYIESKFENWMSWENRGLYNGTKNYGWDLDHIIPISSANNEQQIIQLNHYKNFQPLCSYMNRQIKKDKLWNIN